MTDDLAVWAEKLLESCGASGLKVVCAESCTGGLISATLTEVAGASSVMDCSFVTYSNGSKTRLLGVDAELIEVRGAVSAPVANAMAQGALERSDANIAIAVTGIAGPAGGSEEKPVGLVYIACATDRGRSEVREKRYGDRGRRQVRHDTVADALRLMGEAARTYGA